MHGASVRDSPSPHPVGELGEGIYLTALLASLNREKQESGLPSRTFSINRAYPSPDVSPIDHVLSDLKIGRGEVHRND